LSDGRPNLLRVGQVVSETTRVLSAEPKVVRKTGEEMIVVGVEKRFENEEGVAVVDRRYAPPFPSLFSQVTGWLGYVGKLTTR
jgi:hypothetical protein